MMNWVLMFITKMMSGLYYSFYVLVEGFLKAHKYSPIEDNVVSSIALNLSLLIVSTCCYFRILLSKGFILLFALILYPLLRYILMRYYKPVAKSIVKRYKSDSIYVKTINGVIAFLISIFCYCSVIIYNFI